MNQKTFMNNLRKGIARLPKNEREEIIADYEEHFAEGKRQKRKEEDIAQALGSPKTLAKQHTAQYHVNAAKQKATIGNVTRAIIATISLGLLNLIIMIGPIIAIIGVLIGLFAAAIGIAAGGLGGLAIGIVALATGLAVFGLGAIFSGIALAGLALLWFIGTLYLSKYFIKGLVWYMRLNITIVRGDRT